MNTTKDYTINAVRKALLILKLFEKNNELSLLEISSLTGIGKSSALRFLYTLHQEGFIAFDEKNKRYSLGVLMFQLGSLKFANMDYRKIILPLLQKIADETSLICYLGVKAENMLAMIERVYPRTVPSWAQMMSRAGGTLPLYSTGIGRLFLAQMPDAEVKEYLEKTEIRKATPDTVVDRDELMKLVKRARVEGVAYNKCENEVYICSICGPIYDHRGVMVAGVSLSGMKDVIFGLDHDRYKNMILGAVSRTSRELGYEGIK